jgi:hypothetical protein
MTLYVCWGRVQCRRWLTGESWVPVLVLDDGKVIEDSKNVAQWARTTWPGSEAAHVVDPTASNGRARLKSR